MSALQTRRKSPLTQANIPVEPKDADNDQSISRTSSSDLIAWESSKKTCPSTMIEEPTVSLLPTRSSRRQRKLFASVKVPTWSPLSPLTTLPHPMEESVPSSTTTTILRTRSVRDFRPHIVKGKCLTHVIALSIVYTKWMQEGDASETPPEMDIVRPGLEQG